MKNNILNEIDRMKSLLKHERGVVISEQKNLGNLFKTILTEQSAECVLPSDDLCAILCKAKVAKNGCPISDVVKQLQNGLINGGFNPDKQGGGMIEGCKEDYTKCDGKFRNETEQATIEFQKTIPGLTPDGIIGYNTLKAMIDKGLIKEPQCKCDEVIKKRDERRTRIKKGTKWYEKINKDGWQYDDCATIKYCLSVALEKGTTFSYDAFIKCFEGEGQSPVKSDCPPKSSINCMPRTANNLPKECSDEALRKACPGSFVY
jgi:hypothetical protein